MISLLAFLLLALEELFFKLNSQPVTGCIDPRTHSIDHEDTYRSRRVTLLLRWMRMVQLGVLGVIFAMAAASSGLVILFTVSGQLAGLLLLLQLARIITRKVVDHWSVLRAVVILQGALLLVLAAQGLGAEEAVPPYRSLDWLMTSLAFFGLFLLSVTVAFCSTYVLRLSSREGSPTYYSLPPVAFSEYWIRRIARTVVMLTAATLLLHVLLSLLARYPIGAALLQGLLLALLLPSLLLFRSTRRLHHPAAVFLAALAWVVNTTWTLAGFTATSGSWFD